MQSVIKTIAFAILLASGKIKLKPAKKGKRKPTVIKQTKAFNMPPQLTEQTIHPSQWMQFNGFNANEFN